MTTEIKENITNEKKMLYQKIQDIFLKYPELKNNIYPDELFLVLHDYLVCFADGVAMDNVQDQKRLVAIIKKFFKR